MTKRTSKARKTVDQFSTREEMLRVLHLGGARGNFGFGRYPEGIFASVRDMVFVKVAAC
jgi:hypothetical protein